MKGRGSKAIPTPSVRGLVGRGKNWADGCDSTSATSCLLWGSGEGGGQRKILANQA